MIWFSYLFPYSFTQRTLCGHIRHLNGHTSFAFAPTTASFLRSDNAPYSSLQRQTESQTDSRTTTPSDERGPTRHTSAFDGLVPCCGIVTLKQRDFSADTVSG
jgi:hypothetical protein